MDLTKTAPRSSKDKLAGLVSLKRAIDKAKAHNEGKLGEYDYDCPHDKPLFEFLGTNGDEFSRKVAELDTDDAIANWVRLSFWPRKLRRRSRPLTPSACGGIPTPVLTAKNTSTIYANRLPPDARRS